MPSWPLGGGGVGGGLFKTKIVPYFRPYFILLWFVSFGHTELSKFSNQWGLATAFDLAAFRLSMIAPVKKSVNHSRTVASMRETG